MKRLVFFKDHRGREPVREYTAAVEKNGEATGLAVIRRELETLAKDGPILGLPHETVIVPKRGIRELRPGDNRIAYVGTGDEIVLLHAWRKRTQKLDTRERRRAELNLARFREEERKEHDEQAQRRGRPRVRPGSGRRES